MRGLTKCLGHMHNLCCIHSIIQSRNYIKNENLLWSDLLFVNDVFFAF